MNSVEKIIFNKFWSDGNIGRLQFQPELKTTLLLNLDYNEVV
jgi:hypothetical protein